ncbi:NnrU family protein [Dactylosporangium sp. NBC_01737]|uniref:methanethiol S-methyltransferase n=1 Tax=Dactylosporangium sp. NBC_01737 TaxID=2975959 RepID=UPI002E14971C|nr:methanethiol S-methyltransferase [Dactylosporangium sp. NBC_01737]WSG39685.1 NnrU family protein [Dactylosporangium sp. NBC_01737]
MIRKALVLVYGATAYLGFLATLLYTIGFLAGVVVPKGVDDGTTGPAWRALLVDAALLTLFAVQHSVMARPWFKRWWTRIVPTAIERSTYVLASTAVLVLLLWLWQPLPATVWTVGPAWARGILWGLYALGWIILVFSTFAVGHFDLFGLRQILDRARDRQYAEPGFREPWVYRLVRHPLMVGFLIAFWAAPDLSVGRLVFAVAGTGYIMVGVRLEEHDLKAQLGEPYEDYLRRVPRFVPRPVR